MDEGLEGESQGSVLGLEDDVFELDLHGSALVHLEGNDAGFGSGGGFVGDVDGEFAVDVLLDAISLGDDFVFVPAVFLDGGLDFFVVSGFSGDFDVGFGGGFAFFDDYLFATFGEDAAAFFLVEDPAVFVTVFEIRLVTADDEFGGIDDFAAVLDAAVGVFFFVTRGHFVFEGEGEIGGFAAFPGEEGVVGDGIFLGGFGRDGAVDHGPEFRVAFPVGKVFAVEKCGFRSDRRDGEEGEKDEVFHDDG